ncbi:MAG TPA: hypothetical protein VGN05_15980 [Parvibaculum sp.]
MSEPSTYNDLTFLQLVPVFIGRCAQEWVEVEHQLSGLLARISGMSPEVADVIVATVSSNKIHRDIITQVAKVKYLDPQLQHKIDGLLRRCAKAAKKRNTLVHAFYLSRSETEVVALRHVTQLDFPGEEIVLNLKWLNEALEQIHILAVDIYEFTESLGGSHSLAPRP